jgi:hypothetical protein
VRISMDRDPRPFPLPSLAQLSCSNPAGGFAVEDTGHDGTVPLPRPKRARGCEGRGGATVTGREADDRAGDGNAVACLTAPRLTLAYLRRRFPSQLR